MEIDLETTADRRQIQDLIKKKSLDDTNNLRQELHLIKNFINRMKQKQPQQHSIKTPKKTETKLFFKRKKRQNKGYFQRLR